MNIDYSPFRESEAKTQTVTVRLTPTQKETLSKLAERKGTNLSKYILWAIGASCEFSDPACEVRRESDHAKMV